MGVPHFQVGSGESDCQRWVEGTLLGIDEHLQFRHSSAALVAICRHAKAREHGAEGVHQRAAVGGSADLRRPRQLCGSVRPSRRRPGHLLGGCVSSSATAAVLPRPARSRASRPA
ncbi:hypothetical protein RU01_09830 [Rhodococcus sp. MEB064]|nr:hypothetical protein RU01_09830 [Rhodococcus sp. MEB064]